MILGQGETRLLLEGEAVEAALENGFHRAVGEAANAECPGARGFKAFGRIPVPEPQEPEAGAVALLGVRLRFHDPSRQLSRGGPRLLRPGR